MNPIDKICDNGTIVFYSSSYNKYSNSSKFLLAVVGTEKKTGKYSDWTKQYLQKVLSKENGYLILDPTVYQTTSYGNIRGHDFRIYPEKVSNYEQFLEEMEKLNKLKEERKEKEQEKAKKAEEERKIFYNNMWEERCKSGWEKRNVTDHRIGDYCIQRIEFEIKTSNKYADIVCLMQLNIILNPIETYNFDSHNEYPVVVNRVTITKNHSLDVVLTSVGGNSFNLSFEKFPTDEELVEQIKNNVLWTLL